ncbi:MAG TPA: penicillin acylase family protein [Gammaproteobacteria bacterium]|nr:penicillin acylase family protein [Gammaproteobacteria bacterium]
MLKRAAWWGGGIIGVILLIAGGAIYGLLHGSLPQLDGKTHLVGLSAPVTVTRDKHGVPTITAKSALDAVQVLGYLHAQDRFFQMDLLRRAPAGEVAALAGPAAVEHDRSRRLFRMRAVAEQVLRNLPDKQRALIEAYTLGVNQGLAALTVRPFEYLLLRQEPARWRPEDSILVIFAMYFDLQDETDAREQALAVMHAALPPALYRFLTPAGTAWDAPMKGKPLAPPPIPGPDIIDLSKQPPRKTAAVRIPPPAPVAGSNNWAVAGERTATGAALLASDMHLHLGVPPIWYRAQLVFPGSAPSHEVFDTTGVTLPGAPGIVAGSNGHVAWGFTVAYGDWADLVTVEPDPKDPDRYLTPEGYKPFEDHRETIKVNGAPDVTMNVRDTIWGPVIGKTPDGEPMAVHWAGAQPGATNLEIWNLQSAHDVDGALDIAERTGIPAQNFVVAGADGHIGWTIAGRIPKRIGSYDPSLPASWANGTNGWDGWIKPGDYPRIVDPDGGFVWTANNRTVGGRALKLLGNGGYALGARAQQIHADLESINGKATPADMLAIQLDDRARFLTRWHDLLLRLLTPEALAGHERRVAFRRYVASWGGRAATDSVGYRLVRAFHDYVRSEVLALLTAPCRKADPEFKLPALRQFEGSLWELVEQQPPNLLDPRYKSWNDYLLAAVDAVIGDLWQPDGGLEHRTWGQENTVAVRHPLSRAVPLLSPWLDMPVLELPGDDDMPRVQGTDFGASERMAVAPGDEVHGIFELPGGESGNPLSPFYGDQFMAWATGKPTPFLPGPEKYRMVFEPANAGSGNAL